ncbi:xanthine dehydrogenase accessory protein XdhC [Kushneria indalinina]|uniref:Molybdenum cofactor sulfurylase n=1 Tax=Kushneria indalinina DSM 14324 TaxID=1122140 RepID=A0A3D9DWA0_9GAMM|nr:xanthine dehydrogenase accessory protein XdhC [Kushneria indalinina]REC94614.1 molybdenum cofactor sulfurylase [Kushneria indalinina DSM 14324]
MPCLKSEFGYPGLRWYEALADCQRRGVSHACAQIVTSAGSTPREPGSQLVVTDAQSFDTLGGGRFEQEVIETARQALACGESGCRLESFSLGTRSGQCCGGHVEVLLTLYPAPGMQIALFGAGHVAQALEPLLGGLGWRVDWFDTRPTTSLEITTHAPTTHCHFGLSVDEQITRLPTGGHCLIMTHDHALDETLLAAMMAREDQASLGLIGSQSKRARFARRLRDRGLAEHCIDALRCPLGNSGGDKRPQAIAIAIVAELLTLDQTSPPPVLRGLPREALSRLEAAAAARRETG